MIRFIFLLLGVLLVLEGYAIIVEPRFYSFRFHRYMDFTGYNLALGIAMITVGLLFIWTEVRRRFRSRKD